VKAARRRTGAGGLPALRAPPRASRWRPRIVAVAVCAGCLATGSLASLARAESADPDVVLDRAAVRFYAPETGGTAYPRFIFERTLAFEARLSAMAGGSQAAGPGYDERDVRDALEHHVAEEILSSLADRLIADSPPERRPPPGVLDALARDIGRAFVEELGGRPRIDDAARAERIDGVEVEAIVRRRAMAAWYIDRALTPILHPSEEQLRDVFRTSAHPYRGRPFKEVRDALERWFVVERVRAAESAFLQAARSRVRIIVTR
jgi:hypothetical protein